MTTDPFVRALRAASPYIGAHRDRTFVVALSDAALDGRNGVDAAHDLALLHALGVRLVLVCTAEGTVNGYRRNGEGLVVSSEQLDAAVRDISQRRVRIEALLGTGLPGRLPGAPTPTLLSGNLLTARPLGIRDGRDHQRAGELRRIDNAAVHRILDARGMVCLVPVAASPSGELFVLDGADLAAEAAARIGADKLIWLSEADALHDERGERISEITPGELDARIDHSPAALRDALARLTKAVRAGVSRGHLIGVSNGTLLRELFTREGCGTQITETPYETLRIATPDDSAGICELIRPLQASGELIDRSQSDIERLAQQFSVVELDGLIIGCAALLPLDGETFELACFAAHPDYREHRPSGGRRTLGERLLEDIERRARAAGATRLVALTTRAEHWFTEHGFVRGRLDDLPAARRAGYDAVRASRILTKALR